MRQQTISKKDNASGGKTRRSTFDIRDPKGLLLHRHTTGSCARKMINTVGAEIVTVSDMSGGRALLTIILKDGCSFSHISTMEGAKRVLYRWRSIYGAPLFINREAHGVVEKHNPVLGFTPRSAQRKQHRCSFFYTPKPEEMVLINGFTPSPKRRPKKHHQEVP